MRVRRKPQIDLDLDYVNKLKAIGMSDKSIPEVTFSFADYQCLERLMNVRDITVEDELKEFLAKIHEQDNDEVCANVAEIIDKQNSKFFAALDVQTESVKQIQSDITKISKSVLNIEEDITEIKKRITDVEDRVSAEDVRILKLEQYVKPKWIVVRIAVTIIIALLATLLVHYWFVEPLHKIFIK